MERSKTLVERGLKHAKTFGYHRMSTKDICKEEGVSHTMIFHYFVTNDNFRDKVVELAIEKECLPVIASALAARHEKARAAPRELKERAVATLLA